MVIFGKFGSKKWTMWPLFGAFIFFRQGKAKFLFMENCRGALVWALVAQTRLQVSLFGTFGGSVWGPTRLRPNFFEIGPPSVVFRSDYDRMVTFGGQSGVGCFFGGRKKQLLHDRLGTPETGAKRGHFMVF